jgi:hypothetical protein
MHFFPMIHIIFLFNIRNISIFVFISVRYPIRIRYPLNIRSVSGIRRISDPYPYPILFVSESVSKKLTHTDTVRPLSVRIWSVYTSRWASFGITFLFNDFHYTHIIYYIQYTEVAQRKWEATHMVNHERCLSAPLLKILKEIKKYYGCAPAQDEPGQLSNRFDYSIVWGQWDPVSTTSQRLGWSYVANFIFHVSTNLY